MTDDQPETQARGTIELVRDGHIARLILNNPLKLNALSQTMWSEIVATLDTLRADKTALCVLFEGQGVKAFCAGADIDEKGDSSTRDPAPEDPAYAALSTIQSFPKPTIAMISGYCLGAGLILAAACDLRVACRTASFSIPAARLGLATDFGVLKRLTALVGPANAKRIIFIADRFSASEAQRMGLVDELVDEDVLHETTLHLASRIAENAPLTIAAAKFGIETAMSLASQEDLSTYKSLERACMQSKDYAEGRRAFAEKRKPSFSGC